ncbi:cyclase family protein [Rhodococcus sp. (in: high G+C Gram-positive bacteria)]|uniref:cyclase family protein n=1 Tax=Rhodococcus sp. TaxID=1831 RepID=UPI0025808AD9|nr:cyclase family protein [Rhodococcus sp. (in: high G+C Gram-positive bacteria)]MBQ9055215.1 cyclase family protein [Rhodococcus sp. (in: high G+C Gram-positive bacteria)]
MSDHTDSDTEPSQDMTLLQQYIDHCTNWGRWGAADELGALNLVGAEQIKGAAALVRSGKAIDVTYPYDQSGPQPGGFRANPQLYVTASGVDHVTGHQDPLPGGFGPANGFGFSDDVVMMPTQCGTQWDSLSHIFWKGRMYNNRSAGEVTSKGAAHNGIEQMTGRIVMRGHLIDMARHHGVESLDPGHAIEPADLDAYIEAHGLDIQPGDALLLRTGFMAARRNDWGDYAGGDAPGFSLHMAPWLRDHDIAAIATDTWGVEVRPNQIDVFQPLHVVLLVHGGLAFGEMFDLDALAADCAEDGVHSFMFVASPLPLTGASGAPVSAVAVK